jgi:hypothetical protein
MRAALPHSSPLGNNAARGAGLSSLCQTLMNHILSFFFGHPERSEGSAFLSPALVKKAAGGK